jgi:hypothetical protein
MTKLIEHSVLTRHIFRYEVDDVPNELVPYQRTGERKMFRPETAYIEFVSWGDGVHRLSKNSIYGRKLKQDGTVGKAPARLDGYGSALGLPDWFKALIQEARASL